MLAMFVVAGLGLWWRGAGSTTPDIEPAATAAPPGADDTLPMQPLPEATATSAGKPEPLPPANAPLAQVLPELEARANAGDRRAACRLGMELLRCQQLAAWDALMSKVMDGNSEAEYEAQGNLAAANSIAEEKLWRLERMANCRGVPAGLQGQGARYLRQAALAGDSYALVAYAEGHHWPPNARGIARGTDFDQWRQEAPGMMHAAVRAGNPTAAFMLQMNYSDDFGFLSAMIPDDTYRSFVYHLLSVRLFGHRENQALARDLDAADMERARAEAIALHERYYGGRKYPSSRALQYPPYMRTRVGEPESFCEETP